MAETKEFQLRRAPKYLPFLLTGGAFGLILALIAFFGTGQAATADWATTLGLCLLFFTGIGSLSGAWLATLFDRVNSAKSKRVQATKLEE